ncbi:hypothetical protein MATL_G00075880 [Megalops atlanticus]|uniref:RING-type E3 ubiquitin transferase n=1 Tax=Megalops atlanticus TaxID=7932 RepID=A0A9D3Q540_MEGAT|nr:hypothetical protein MATL_G00075880 [Megalops atlanticus]
MSLLDEPDLPSNLACLKNVDALLRCPICFDYFSISMMTKCSHNFCSLCIRKFLSYKLQCPVCNSAMTEQDLRNNRILDDLVRSFQAARQQLSKMNFDSPPVSPKTLHPSVKRKAPNPKRPKMESTILTHFLQKGDSSPSSTTPLKEPRTQPACRNKSVSQNPLREKPVEVPSQDTRPVKEEPVEIPTAGPSSLSASNCESPSTSQSVKAVVKVECPVCSVGVPEQYINKHLDSCLLRDEKRESLRSADSKRKPLTKLVYTLMTVRELKKRLKEFHLPTQGSRDELIWRHQEFVHMYNAQCDSLNPKSAEEIAKEVEENEKMRAKLQCKSKRLMVFSKNQTEEEIQEMHSKYRKQHSDEFSHLIAQVKGRWGASRRAPIKEEMQEGGTEGEGGHPTAINKEGRNSTKQCLPRASSEVSTEEMTSEVIMRSPSPTFSDVSISSSISDVFNFEADRSNENAENAAGGKRRAPSSRDKDTAPAFISEKCAHKS